MESLSLEIIALLAAVAFAAGFVDALAGGGGLITVPALALAGLDPISAIATNKLQSSFGSASAMLTFWRAGHLQWREIAPVMVFSALGAVIGASFLTSLPVRLVYAALPVVLIAVAAYFTLSPGLSDAGGRQRISKALFTGAFVPLIGAYDGVFGPGTGSFFMAGFTALLGYGIVRATAQTKAANFASNIAGLAALSLGGHIVWALGLAMGTAQVLGAALGARAAISSGARLIKPLVAGICLLLALRLLADPAGPWRDLLGRIAALR